MESTQTPIASVPASGIFGTRIPSAVAFAVGVLLFLLPFAQVKCNGTALLQNSGLGIAMGSEWKKVGGSMFDEKGLGGTTTKDNNEKKQKPNIYAIAALALGVLGLLLSLANAKAAGLGGLVTGVLSAGALIGMMIDLKNSSELKAPDMGGSKPDDGGLGLDKLSNMKITIDFTPWFYVAVVAFLVAVFFCYKRMQSARS